MAAPTTYLGICLRVPPTQHVELPLVRRLQHLRRLPRQALALLHLVDHACWYDLWLQHPPTRRQRQRGPSRDGWQCRAEEVRERASLRNPLDLRQLLVHSLDAVRVRIHERVIRPRGAHEEVLLPNRVVAILKPVRHHLLRRRLRPPVLHRQVKQHGQLFERHTAVHCVYVVEACLYPGSLPLLHLALISCAPIHLAPMPLLGDAALRVGVTCRGNLQAMDTRSQVCRR